MRYLLSFRIRTSSCGSGSPLLGSILSISTDVGATESNCIVVSQSVGWFSHNTCLLVLLSGNRHSLTTNQIKEMLDWI